MAAVKTLIAQLPEARLPRGRVGVTLPCPDDRPIADVFAGRLTATNSYCGAAIQGYSFDVIWGAVDSSNGYGTYEVSLRRRDDSYSFGCACPSYGSPCKHIGQFRMAVAQRWQQEQKRAATASSDPRLTRLQSRDPDALLALVAALAESEASESEQIIDRATRLTRRSATQRFSAILSGKHLVQTEELLPEIEIPLLALLREIASLVSSRSRLDLLCALFDHLQKTESYWQAEATYSSYNGGHAILEEVPEVSSLDHIYSLIATSIDRELAQLPEAECVSFLLEWSEKRGHPFVRDHGLLAEQLIAYGRHGFEGRLAFRRALRQEEPALAHALQNISVADGGWSKTGRRAI